MINIHDNNPMARMAYVRKTYASCFNQASNNKNNKIQR